MGDKIAIIDLGTNTFHLLLAEVDKRQHRIFYREKVPVKIGLGGINRNIITEAGILRAIDAMKGFQAKLLNYKIDLVYAFGTSALRNATNGVAVSARIEAETGIPVKIISGDEEAEYIYKGVRSAVKMNSTSLIVDIGGGSVEFIIGNDSEIFWKQSVEIGAQRLLEKFQKHDPILPEEIDELMAFFKISLLDLFHAIRKYRPQDLVGSSGTFDTLSEIYCNKKGIEFDSLAPETPLTMDSFFETFNELIVKNREERMKIPGMMEMRVDMIVVACCLISFLLVENLNIKNLRVSSYSLKEGVLGSLLQY